MGEGIWSGLGKVSTMMDKPANVAKRYGEAIQEYCNGDAPVA